jgi:hypothetical protein
MGEHLNNAAIRRNRPGRPAQLTPRAVLLCIPRIHLHQERNQSVRFVARKRTKVSKPLADTRLNGVT